VIEALGFLSVIGRGRPPSPGALRWFPVVGVLLGLAVGGIWWVAGELWPPALAAALAVAADLAITGLLHVDGLADAADGVLPHLKRERRLEVMAAPDAGAFAVGVVAVVLLLRFAAFASTGPEVLAVAGLWCAGRTVMAVGLRSLPYARADGGLATAFGGNGDATGVAVVGVGLTLALTVAGSGAPGLLASAAAVVAGVGVLRLADHRLGGYTGDVLGAAGLVAETVGLVVLAARW
jgi:adenosylcobinamide-GDP ribazoletransferase